jgi:hypothetical protein
MSITADQRDHSIGTAAADSRLVVIARQEWVAALNGFTRRHDGWLVSLDIIPPQGQPLREFENLPLRGVSSDRVNHDGTLVISVSWSRNQHLTHMVHSVARLSIEQTADGADAALWIDAKDGTRTVLRLRVAALPETVDGYRAPLSRGLRKRGRS